MTDTIAAEIRSLLGVTDNDPKRGHRLKIRNAAETAKDCAGCGHELKPDEPVWRLRVGIGPGFMSLHRYAIAPHCRRCYENDYRSCRSTAKPCGGCGRPVYESDSNFRRYTACCEKCRKLAVTKAAQSQRQQARGSRVCEGCGKTFEPTRADARFCTVACKQRAYRRRVTDNTQRPLRGGAKRNASPPVLEQEWSPIAERAIERGDGFDLLEFVLGEPKAAVS